jgi:hypothetical protein
MIPHWPKPPTYCTALPFSPKATYPRTRRPDCSRTGWLAPCRPRHRSPVPPRPKSRVLTRRSAIGSRTRRRRPRLRRRRSPPRYSCAWLASRRLLLRHDAILVSEDQEPPHNPSLASTDDVYRRGPTCADKRVRLPLPLPGMLNLRKYVCRSHGHPLCGRSIRFGREPSKCAGISTRACTGTKAAGFQSSSQTDPVAGRIECREGGRVVLGSVPPANRRTR